MKVILRNDVGMVKECKVGFSWTTMFFGLFVPLTTMFFGLFVPLIRGDIKNALIMGALSLLTFGLSWLVFPFTYNKMYIKGLLMQGFKGSTEQDNSILVQKGFIVNQNIII